MNTHCPRTSSFANAIKLLKNITQFKGVCAES